MKNKFIEKKIDNFEGITTFQLNYKCRLHLNIGYVELKRLKTKDADTLFLCILHQSNEYSNRSPGFLFLEDNSFIIRINNSENIQLGRPTIDRKSGQESHYDYHYDYNYQEKKSYNWYKEWYTYEITPEQLQKICEADMVAIKVNNNVYDDKDFQHLFLEHCKLFYNGTYDSTLYIDTIKNQYKKEKQEQEQIVAENTSQKTDEEVNQELKDMGVTQEQKGLGMTFTQNGKKISKLRLMKGGAGKAKAEKRNKIARAKAEFANLDYNAETGEIYTPNTNQTSVWITYNSSEKAGEVVEHNVKTNNTLYVVEDADQAYMNNSITYPHGGGNDSLFAKGKISLITNEYIFTSGTFGIETSNEELKKHLNNDVKIRVQYHYKNESMNKVESSMGYHSIQRENNQDVESSQPYDTRRYNRSIFGRKADGTYVLMTVAKGEYSGTTHNESNAILKQFGVIEAYQQDGGGSVTAIIRNANNEFDIVNQSSDSGSKERSIFNGCFFVVRDSGYRAYQKDSTKNSITLTKVNNYNDEYITNLKAVVNNQTYDITEDTLTIDNLEYDTEYIITLTFDVTINGKVVKACQQIIAHTDSFTMPPSGIRVIKTTANSIILERKELIEDEVVFANVTLNSQVYDLKEANKQIEILNLEPSTIYTLQIHYAVRDSIDGKVYEEFEETVQMTKKYNIPEIKTFEITKQTKNSIEINFEIIDDFNLAYAYYISYNGNQIDCEELTGTYIIEDLNLKKNEYELILVIQYKENGNFKSINSDVLKTTIINSTCLKNNYIYINLFAATLLLYITLKKRK